MAEINEGQSRACKETVNRWKPRRKERKTTRRSAGAQEGQTAHILADSSIQYRSTEEDNTQK